MEAWRECWRRVIGRHLPTIGLEALEAGILSNDPMLEEGADNYGQWDGRSVPDRACAIAYPLVKMFPEATCLQIEEMNPKADVSAFIGWFDDSMVNDRPATLSALLPEVSRILALRSLPVIGPPTVPERVRGRLRELELV